MARWVRVATLVCAAIVFTGFVFTYLHAGVSILSMAFAGLCLLACGAIIEVFYCKIILDDTALHVVLPWSRKSYPRAEISRATWEGGCPASIQLATGNWVSLPSVGRSTQGVVNSIRAWLKPRKALNQEAVEQADEPVNAQEERG